MASPASNVSRSLEGNPTSTPSSGNAATSSRPAVDVTAITTRDDFLLELGDALDGQASLRPVETAPAALEHLANTKRGQVLVIDARDCTDVRHDVQSVQSRAPHVVIIVFATAEAERQISAAVKGTDVLAVLPLPVDPRKTAAVLEGAIADAAAKRNEARAPASDRVHVEPFTPAAPPAPATVGRGAPSRSVPVWGAIAAGVFALAAGSFWFLQGHAPTPTVRQPGAGSGTVMADTAADAALARRPSVETSLAKGSSDELLEKARLAMRERRYTEPSGDNALLYYRSAVAADATNGEALDGLQRVATVLARRFDESMNAARFDEASVTLANFKSAAPRDSRVPALELRLATAQISKSLADGNIDRAAALLRLAQQSTAIPADQINKWRSDIARRQEDAKLQRLANLVVERIKDGRLLDPVQDSAKAYLVQLHEAAPVSATTQRATRELNAAYLRKAREASLSKAPGDADRWLAEAKAGGLTANELTSFQHDLGLARQKSLAAEAERLAGLARDRLRDGKLTDPVQDSAAYYLTQIQTSDANSTALVSGSRDLASKLLERARIEARDPSKAALVDADLTQARRWGADARDIQAVQQAQTNLRAAANSSPRAASAAANVDLVALASQLKRTRSVQPEYPAKALNDKISGVVMVEFIVDASGNTRDIRVVEATPPGVFDKAATSAVKRWRYDPLKVNDQPVEIPVRTAIRFELPK